MEQPMTQPTTNGAGPAPTPAGEPMLSVRHMVKRFGGLTAVNDVSLDVSPGEVVGLVGDNGAGKSTLIKCISGVYHADQGDLILEGKTGPLRATDRGTPGRHRDHLSGPGAGRQPGRQRQHLPGPRDEEPLSASVAS